MANGNELSSAYEPLLSSQEHNSSTIKNFVKWILKTLIWAVFAGWIFLILLSSFDNTIYMWINVVEGDSIFSLAGGATLVFTAPILILACLAAAYLMIGGDEKGISMDKKPLSGKLRPRLWTFSLLVDGPLGFVSAAEIIGICLVVVYVILALVGYNMKNLNLVDTYPTNQTSVVLLEYTGKSFAAIGMYFLGFLFVPITRGSILLRFLDIPFEHAMRYHIWLENLTLLMFTVHGLLYIIGYTLQANIMVGLRRCQSSRSYRLFCHDIDMGDIYIWCAEEAIRVVLLYTPTVYSISHPLGPAWRWCAVCSVSWKFFSLHG